METHQPWGERRELHGRVALVTGAGGGLGAEIALVLANDGAAVAVVDRNGPQARRVAAEIGGCGGTAIGMSADISCPEEVDAVLARTVAEFGGLHIVVNNAAVTGSGTLLATTEEKWDACLAVNTRGTFLCSRSAAPHLPPGTGVIVNIASVAGLVALSGAGVAYSASKSAVVELTRALAVELSASGIRVNAVCPGTVLTQMVAEFLTRAGNGDAQLGAERIGRQYPLGRLGRPGEIAQAVRYLVSDDAATVTGQILPVDGGVSLCAGAAAPREQPGAATPPHTRGSRESC